MLRANTRLGVCALERGIQHERVFKTEQCGLKDARGAVLHVRHRYQRSKQTRAIAKSRNTFAIVQLSERSTPSGEGGDELLGKQTKIQIKKRTFLRASSESSE